MNAPFPFPSAEELSPFPAPPDGGGADPRTTALEDDDRRFLWKPFTQMLTYERERPLIIEQARGMWLCDVRGRSLLDGVSSLWVNLHGHRHAAIDQAVADQLGRVAHSTMLGPSTVPAIELARRLVEVAPSPALTRVFYSDSGSTAVEIAIKMAFQYWRQCGAEDGAQRSIYIHLDDAYHGDTIGSVSVGGMELFHGTYGPLLFETDRAPSPYCYRCPAGRSYPGCAQECLDGLRLAFGRHPGRVAALVIEPMVQGAAGIRTYPAEVLAGAAAIAREHGALVIADEVATGFGRTGRMWAVQHAGVEPDLMAVAKGISGGYLPLAATLATERIYEAFKGEPTEYRTFFHGHSYTGNPLACAAALASLRLFDDQGVLDWVAIKTAHLADRLESLGRLPHVGDVRQLGLMVGVELVRDRDTRAPFDPALQVGYRVCREARGRGVLIRPLGDVLVLMPPLGISADELDLLCGVTYESIAAVTAALPERP